jgi:hypothetical protein
MARPTLRDHLQAYSFYLVDIAPIEVLGLPIFTPLFGFNAITAPEITVETQEVVECNWSFHRKVVKKASIGTMTLSRGALFYDSDFWRWIKTAISGNTEDFQSSNYGLAMSVGAGALDPGGSNLGIAAAAASSALGLFGFPRIGGPSPRRDLMLVQLFAHMGTGELAATAITGLLGVASVLGAGAAIGGFGKAARVPAKAWLLKGCIPVRYKVAGDFDATSSEVSIQELDIECENVDEVSLAGG